MNQIILFGLTSTDWAAIFTLVLAVIALVQVVVYCLIHNTTRRAERAYIDLSPRSPGLKFTNVGASIVPSITMTVGNYGKTPGIIASVTYQRHIGNGLPESPMYGRAPIIGNKEFVLMPDQRISIEPADIPLEPIPWETADRIRAGDEKLWIIGYVVYRDQFGTTYTGGHARLYEPSKDVGDRPDKDVQNLNVELHRGYNYDRKKKSWKNA